MDEFLKKLLDEAAKNGAVKVIKVEHDHEDHDEPATEVDEFAEVAATNMKLFKAHLDVGFTSEQALEIVKCMINNIE